MKKHLLLCFLAATLSVFLVGKPRTVDVDSQSYLLMAEGRIAEVVRPYSARLLHPMIASMVQRGLELTEAALHTDLTPDTYSSEAGKETALEKKWGPSFCVVTGLALFVFLLSLHLLLQRYVSGFPCFVLFLSPILARYVVNIYLPDLFFAALLALWFLVLDRQQWLLGSILLFLLVLTRESSLLIGAIYCGCFALKREWRFALAGGFAMVCGMIVVHELTKDARPNIHELGGFSYLVMKVVSNSLANFFGVNLWTNTYANMLPHFYPDPPVWKMLVPYELQSGTVREVGIYRFDINIPLRTVLTLFSTFGLLTFFSCFLFGKERWRRLKALPEAFQLALIIGLSFFVLAPLTGRSVERLVGYAWPAFWLAIPILVDRDSNHASRLRRGWFWCLHVGISWLPVIVSR